MFEEAIPLLSRSRSTPAAHADEVDLPALVAAHAQLLFRVAHSVTRNRSEAEDVVQDTFLRVLQHRSSLPAVRDLRAWLLRITWNLALDRHRRRRHTPDQADDLFLQALISPGTPADLALAQAEQTRAVLHALDHLPAAERQALLLSAIDELGTPEIAAAMGKSHPPVPALLFRARTRLRQRLTQGGKQ